MAYNSETPRVEYTASASQTLFSFLFKIYEKTDIVVYQTPVGDAPDDDADILVVDVDYTVAITGDSGGTVTLTSGATAGDALTLLRELPTDRDVEYQTNGDILADVINDDQNYQTYLIADQKEKESRSLALSNSVQGVSTEIPAPVALNFLQWNSNANALINVASLQAGGYLWTAADVYTKTEVDAFAVKLTGVQTIAGVKTFSDSPIAPTPTLGDNSTKVATTEFVNVNSLNTTKDAQTKLGDLTIGETVSVDSWSFDTTTITINTSAIHNLVVDQYFSVSGLVATTNAPNGRWAVVSVVDTDTITFTANDTPTGTPTVSSAKLNHGDIEFYGTILGKSISAAWIAFNGSTTSITDSFNVGNLIKNASGDYDVVFETPMDNANYTVVVSTRIASFGSSGRIIGIDAKTTTGFKIRAAYLDSASSTVANDESLINAIIFGGKN